MKKNVNFKVIQIFLLIAMIILVLVLCFMNLKHKKNENIDGTSNLWDIYDLNLTEMKYNLDKTMDKPKENVTCGNLKGITLKNDSYEALLNNLGCYITLYVALLQWSVFIFFKGTVFKTHKLNYKHVTKTICECPFNC